MAQIIVSIPRYKGEYEFDLDEVFTALEWRWIKKISGYLPLTIDEGWRGGDPDLFVAFAVIAMNRSGKIRREEALQAADDLLDSPFDGTAIKFVVEEEPEEEDVTDGPPAMPAEPPAPEQPLRSIG